MPSRKDVAMVVSATSFGIRRRNLEMKIKPINTV